MASTARGFQDVPVPGSESGNPAEEFCRLLPLEDPIAAQNLLCKELSRLAVVLAPGEDHLRTVLVLDQHAQHIGRRLLSAYAEGDAQLRAYDTRYLLSARFLSRSFVQAYERFLGQVQSTADGPWRTSAPTILIQLFRHRYAELMLRLLRYKRHSSEQWRQVHSAYRYAQENGLESDTASGVVDREPTGERTIHQHFIELLLLGEMNTGQFSPRELLWAGNWIARWSSYLALQPMPAGFRPRRGASGFIVDLDGSEGLKRYEPGENGDLHLDTTALMGTIDEEVAALDAPSAEDDAGEPPSTRHEGSIALLAKLRILFSPEPVEFNRRGDRKPMAIPVQSMSGLRHIVQVVREEARGRKGEVARPAGPPEGVTNAPLSRFADSPETVFHAAAAAPLTISATTITVPKTWQVRDWSDSGCRVRGRANDLNDVIPGSLITIREHESAPWLVCIVRRLRRLMVDHVEISLEFIGRKPRFVKLVNSRHCLPPADAQGGSPRSFGALYLPLSEKRPTLPIKTLVVPAHAFNAGQVVTLLSSSAAYSLRFNKPLEEHADFVWTTFTLIDRR